MSQFPVPWFLYEYCCLILCINIHSFWSSILTFYILIIFVIQNSKFVFFHVFDFRLCVQFSSIIRVQNKWWYLLYLRLYCQCVLPSCILSRTRVWLVGSVEIDVPGCVHSCMILFYMVCTYIVVLGYILTSIYNGSNNLSVAILGKLISSYLIG